MDTFLNMLLNIFYSTLILLGIAIILWIINMIFWKAWFYPINKKIKIDEKRQTIDKEYNKIVVKIDNKQDELEILDAQYKENAAKLRDLELEIQRKQKLIKSYEEEIKNFREWKKQKELKLNESDVDDVSKI